MRLSKLAKALKIDYEGEDKEILSLFIDSRKQAVNGLFFCMQGERSDSHDFAQQAVKNGAVAIVAERKVEVDVPQIIVKDVRLALSLLSTEFYGNPSKRLKVIGITGTNGKTTTAHMLVSILEKSGRTAGLIGTLGITYNGKSFPTDLTTPDPIELQERLADMVLCGVEYAVMEVSAHALYYKKTQGISFTACIFTNFTQDHLDFFKDMERYKQAKLSLFDKDCPLAVVNGDDEVGREIGELRKKLGVRTVYYGLETPVDAFAIITDESLYGSECMLNLSDRLCRIHLSMTGMHNVYNALAAALCGLELKISSNSIAEGLSSFKGVLGRLERVQNLNGAEIYVDFAHTPDGLEKSLNTLKKHCSGRVICLFGCGGNRDKSKRPLMGEIVAKNCHFSVITSDNPRYEDPLDIITDIEKGYRKVSSNYVIVPDRKKAIEYGLEFLRKGDVLLIAGKGGEFYQEIMGIKYPFNDQDIVRKLIRDYKTE